MSAQQTIYHDDKNISFITLPIIKQSPDQKQIPELFFGDNSGRHTEKPPEEQKEIDEHNERMSKLYEDEWKRLDNL